MNVNIFIMGTLYWIAESRYFGWNLRPQSDAEMICDGIAILIVSISFLKFNKGEVK